MEYPTRYAYSQSQHSGCMAIESAKLIYDRPILDYDPPDFEDLSDNERGGVLPPELEV